jgi:hypothetical protein
VALAELIECRWGISLSAPAAGGYLKSWGLCPRRSICRVCEQYPRALQHQLKESCPAIGGAWRRDGGLLYFLDESGIGSPDKPASTRAPGRRSQRLR